MLLSLFSASAQKSKQEDKAKFERMLEMLDDCEDVQQVYHNVDLGA